MSECIEWMGTRHQRGYGVLRKEGRHVLAHREAYEQAYGLIEDGLSVLHHCDNPPCVNPEHLFLGTQADNMRDMRSKGRGFTLPVSRGETHPRALLTAAQVQAIKKDTRRLGEIAREYGVSSDAIQAIRVGRNWRDA
jgi:hypothetical protein